VPHRAGSFHVKQRQRRNPLYRRCGIRPGFAGAVSSGSAPCCVVTSKSALPGISRTSALPSGPLPCGARPATRACRAHSRPVRERGAIGACTTAAAYRWLVGERGPGEQRKSQGSPERRSTKNASVSHTVLLFHVKRDYPRRTPSLRSAVLHSGERRSRTSVSRETAPWRSDEELRCLASPPCGRGKRTR
jgi:hypothetical protein